MRMRDPTPKQINDICRRIRAEWSPEERIRRRVSTGSSSKYIKNSATQVVPREIWTEFVGQDRQGENEE